MNVMPRGFWVARTPLAAPDDHPAINYGRIGVLLLNLGTPDGTSYWPMRRYLKEFLSDRRVIEVNPVVWWLILNFVVLTKRPFTSGEAYKSVWNLERDELPLRTITRSQCERIGAVLARDPRIEVDWAMRYGNPNIKSRLEALQEKGCDRILIFPLYPQYSSATVGTACDKAFDALKSMRWQPAIRIVPPYFEEPCYIDALTATTRASLAKLDFEPEAVIASFHGLPMSYIENGRSLLLSLRQDDSPSARGPWLEGGSPAADLSVALRLGGMATALYLGHNRKAGKRRREARGRDYAWLLVGLYRNAGGDGHPGR